MLFSSFPIASDFKQLFAPERNFLISVTSDGAVGGAEAQKPRLPAPQNVYNFSWVWICRQTRKAFD